MREGVGKIWVAPCAALIFIGALSAACSTRGSSDVARSGSAADADDQPHRSDGTASDVASIVGTWEFASVSISIVGNRMRFWLPDLGQDRDVDFGDAVEDIDPPGHGVPPGPRLGCRC
jgi:hypothetical protein